MPAGAVEQQDGMGAGRDLAVLVDVTQLKRAERRLEKAREMLQSYSEELEREVRELRRANEILRKASAYFAQAELDRRAK